uniref:Uncharacterized protein n=1 Tax=Arundo donax TaxID=35708 RepID=A0A0A9BHC9_ARUDO
MADRSEEHKVLAIFRYDNVSDLWKNHCVSLVLAANSLADKAETYRLGTLDKNKPESIRNISCLLFLCPAEPV